MHVLVPYISCVVSEQEFNDKVADGYGEVYIETTKGFFKHTRLTHNRYIRTKVESVPNYKSAVAVEEEIHFLPAGKIPYQMFEEIVQFFKDVMNIKKAEQEAMAHILWNPTDGYHIAIPNQVVSKASVKYEFDHIDSSKGDIIVVDMHSHNTMNAFFSGTDDADDRRSYCYSGVVGKLNDLEPATVWRFNLNEIKYKAEMKDIFVMPEKKIEIPTEWLDKVKTYVPQVTSIYSSGRTITSPYSGKKFPVSQLSGSDTGSGRVRGDSKADGSDDMFWYRGDQESLDYLWGEAGYTYSDFAAGEPIPERDKSISTMHSVGGSLAVEPPDEEIPGDKDGNPFESDSFDYHAVSYGKDAAEAYEQIALYLEELEGIDELLLSMMRDIYHNRLSEEGQLQLATKGF